MISRPFFELAEKVILRCKEEAIGANADFTAYFYVSLSDFNKVYWIHLKTFDRERHMYDQCICGVPGTPFTDEQGEIVNHVLDELNGWIERHGDYISLPYNVTCGMRYGGLGIKDNGY